MDRKTTFVAADLDEVTRYRLLIGLVVPRPIGWIGTLGPDGVPNLAPYSFFNVVAGTPPTVLFAPGLTVRRKDSLVNAEATGEFSVNVVTEEVSEAMNLTSGDYPPEVDEFALAGLTAVPGEATAAPMVAESKVNLECRVTQIVDVGDPPGAAVVFGEVLRLHVLTDVLDGTRVDHARLLAVGRLAGEGYCTTRDVFWMPRPSLR
jgi:flavin reductase (DIM6/NTAB) family NADH-FMN oxidoreductase RutF